MLRSRILGLAKKYGTFVRFTPDGNEGDALDGAIKEADKATKTPEQQAAIDNERKADQQLEQEQGNTRRANAAAQQAQADADAAVAANAELKQQLAAATAKAAEAGITNVELDESQYEGTDLALVQKIKAIDAKLEAKDTRIAGLEQKAIDMENQSKADAAKAESNSAYEEVLTDLDSEYGADCRNAALEKFNDLNTKGEIPQGKPAMATRILEKCYKDAKALKDKETPKPKADFDIGGGGGVSESLAGKEIKEGSLDEVAKQYGSD